jgi:hypothetical protein
LGGFIEFSAMLSDRKSAIRIAENTNNECRFAAFMGRGGRSNGESNVEGQAGV